MKKIDFLATDGLKLNGLLYESNQKTDKVILSVDGKEYDLSSDIAQALKSEGMSISDLTYNNWDTLTKGMPLSINKNKNLMIVKNLSSYSVRLNDATKSVASSSEMEAE